MNRTLLTVDEVAATLGIGRTKVYELLRCGKIASVTIGSARRIKRQALDDFVDQL